MRHLFEEGTRKGGREKGGVSGSLACGCFFLMVLCSSIFIFFPFFRQNLGAFIILLL